MKFREVFQCLAAASLLQAPYLVTGQFADTPAFGDNTGSQSCSQDADCPLIQCLIPPCPDAVCVDGSCTIGNLNNPECVQDADCPEPSCFGPCPDESYCNVGICDLRPFGSGGEGEDQSEAGGDTGEEDLSCGPNTCQPGQSCCNRSCGYCVDPGGFCTEEFCLPEESESELLPEEDVPLGGEYSCETDSDCPVIDCFVVPCDEYVCDVAVGLCTINKAPEEEVGDVGEDAYVCEIDSDCPVINCLVAPCDQYICDAEVGICTMAGAACGFVLSANATMDANSTEPARNICPLGHVCCNASCGTCTLPGDMCTQQICSDDSSENSVLPNTTTPVNNNPDDILGDTTLSSTVSREGETSVDKNETATTNTLGDSSEGATATDGEPNKADNDENATSSTRAATPSTIVLTSSLVLAVASIVFV